LSWSHLVQLVLVNDPSRRNFYFAVAAHERWSVRTLRSKIGDKLYERTIAACGSASGIEAEIAGLREKGVASADLAFRDPYVLDFLGLGSEHSEADYLTESVCEEMQHRLVAAVRALPETMDE
jgi:predicted nuclease of restriction endonuclease-like (RecB) superfamily